MSGERTLMEDRRRGERAEQVANWYFRLNGFLSIPGFIIHPDRQRLFPRTEADLIAVRFPYSAEKIADRDMEDDPLIINLAKPPQILFILVEVKSGTCNINGPWSRREEGNMQRVIRRLGFAKDNDEINSIADDMYSHLRWENNNYVLQYIAVGADINKDLKRRYSSLVQITWKDIGKFLFKRFREFPEKLPSDGRPIHSQWPDFGRAYGNCVRRLQSDKESIEAVRMYIETGKIDYS